MTLEKVVGWTVIGLGLLVTLTAVLADQLGGGGGDDFWVTQIIGAIAGLIMVGVGAVLTFRHP